MNATVQHDSRVERSLSNVTLPTAIGLGLIGGLAATVVMDLFGVGMFLVMGGPASLSFSIIGDAAAGFLSMLGINIAGGAPLGGVLHYLIGLALGAILVAAVCRVNALRVNSTKKGVGLGILFVEVMSMPMLTTAAIVLKMTTSETVQWFGISFVMHLVYGLVLGLVVSYGRKSDEP